MAKRGSMIVGLDIDIIGIGTHPSQGLRKGVVVNIDSTVESIKSAIEEAELMSGAEIGSVYAGIAGSHIEGINSHGIVAVKGREVDEDDIRRAIEAAKALAIPLDREILHILPQYFIVDDQDGVKDPIGMSGVRLEAKVHVVIGAVTSVQNIIKSVNRVGLDVNDVVLEPLASSAAVLSQDEKELGVAIIDIGGGTTDIAVFLEGSIKHTSVLPLGGNYLTNDIAVGLRTPMNEAEKIKIKYGCAYTPLIPADDTIDVPSVGGRPPRKVARQILGEIIEPRVEEILRLARREIIKSGYEDLLAAGVVVTGGTAILEGVPDLAEHVFNMPIRRGIPIGIGGLTDVVNSPLYATGVGLVLYGHKNKSERVYKKREGNIVTGIIRRMKKWLIDYF